MRRVLIIFSALAALLIALAALAVGVGYAWLRATVPSASGRLVLGGIAAPIAITRDREDVPHIFAKSRHDLLFGLGFAHAQDRLWQMELSRRSGQGRLWPQNQSAQRSIVPFRSQERSSWTTVQYPTRALI